MRKTITPIEAEEILKNNPDNRKVRNAAVEFLIVQIKAGKFIYNGESVIISVTGKLLNGQHRLIACMLSGIPIEVELVTGVPDEVMPTIDTGSARTAADVFQMNSIKHASSFSTGIRNILTIMQTKRSSTGKARFKVANQDILEFYKNNKQTMEAIGGFSTHQTAIGTKIISAGRVIGYIYLLGTIKDDTAIFDFFREVLTGVRIRESNVANLLRERLIANKISASKMTDSSVHLMIIKAFKHYSNGVTVKYLKIQPGEVIGIDSNAYPNLNLEYAIHHSAK